MTEKERTEMLSDLKSKFPAQAGPILDEAKTLDKEDFVTKYKPQLPIVGMLLGKVISPEDGGELLEHGWELVRAGKL